MNHKTNLLLLSLATLAAGPALAQGVATVPYQNSGTEGIGISFVLARPGYQLTQTIYESRYVYRAAQSYSSILLRPDSSGIVPTMNAMSRHLAVRMSGVGVPSPELASTTSFAANRGSDFATVLNNRVLAFPAVAQRPTPATFAVSIPLDQPFLTTDIAHLLVEFETSNEATTPAPWYPDGEFFQAADWTILTSIHGASCPAGTIGFNAGYLNGDLFAEIASAPDPNVPTHPGVAFLGTSLNQWGSLPLPIHLDVFGAPSCSIYTDGLQSYVGMSRGGRVERFTLRVPVPRAFGLLGHSLYSQVFLLDPTANAFGIRASGYATYEFSSPPDARRTLTLSSQTVGDRPTLVEPNTALILGVQ